MSLQKLYYLGDKRDNKKNENFFIIKVFLFLLTGCLTSHYQGAKVIQPSDVIIYGPSHYQSTRYIGSDDNYHYLRWRIGGEYGDWKIKKSSLAIGCEKRYNETNTVILKSTWQRWLTSK